MQPISEENLSQTAIAFNTSLYTITILNNVEEALIDEKWKQPTKEEYMAL